jgi:glutathione S-transferase
MPEYELYCFAQSGNAYRAALMLNLIGADWQPVYVDFFKGGETRTPKYRTEVNEMGEVPVLAHGTRKLSQSAVILTYLAERAGRFEPDGEDARLEALRWIIFDNQKVNGFLGPYRFLKNFARPAGDPAVLAFLKGRIDGNLGIVDQRLAKAPFMLGNQPTIVDISLAGYLYYPAEEFGFDIAAQFKNIGAWRDRMQALPGWAHPYDLMPGHPLKLKRGALGSAAARLVRPAPSRTSTKAECRAFLEPASASVMPAAVRAQLRRSVVRRARAAERVAPAKRVAGG